jgi:2,3-bisphosphoglycerate-independent phosphoglycerate mutase
MKRTVLLIVRDGWGIRDDAEGNAVLAADTPNMDAYGRNYPRTLLECSGEAVGLPKGYQGSSEVGHLNMGAGRIVIQELKRINDSLATGDAFKSGKWRDLIQNWRDNKSTLHFMGLLQDEGVHAHQDHLFLLLKEARSAYSDGEIVVHPFLDGRDTPPRSSSIYIQALLDVLADINGARIGTIMGRYYAMDRSERWGLTDQAFACIVDAKGRPAADALQAIKKSYEQDKTPDEVEMFDEYIPPHVIGEYHGINDGDSVIHTNYRQDRAIQLTKAFVSENYPGNLSRRPQVVFAGLTRYYNEFTDYLMPPIDSGGGMRNLLGEVVSREGLKQLRIAETQKFRHVTSFFNGKSTKPYPGEEQIEVPSRFDPASFASHPEMEAYNVTDRLLSLCGEKEYDFIVVNYANGDMVGHTGDFDAAKRAIGIVDECVGRVVDFFSERGTHILITADHGNAEEMIDPKTKTVKTSHTVNPVDLIYLARDASDWTIAPGGKLSDIAPTVLELLGLPKPDDMTACCLLQRVNP